MTNYANPWTGKPVDSISDLLPRPNGQTCDECGSPCIDNCIMCGAPQCCPACCYEATPSARITGDKDRSVQSRAPTEVNRQLAIECHRLRSVLRWIADTGYVDHQSGNQNFEHLQSIARDALTKEAGHG